MSILQAAARVLNRHASPQVPVEEILQAAGVSRATFYKHFRTKEELLEGLFDLAGRALMDGIRQAVEHQSGGIERLRAAVRAYLDFHRGETGVVAALQATALNPASRLHEQREQLHERIVDFFQSEIVQADRAPVEPLLLRGVILSLEGISLSVLSKGEPLPLERAERAMMRIAVAAVAEEGDEVPEVPRQPS